MKWRQKTVLRFENKKLGLPPSDSIHPNLRRRPINITDTNAGFTIKLINGEFLHHALELSIYPEIFFSNIQLTPDIILGGSPDI